GLPQTGVYHPGRGIISNLEDWRNQLQDPSRPTAGIVFYRSHWVTGNLAPIDALVRALEERGLNSLAVFGPTFGAVLESGLLDANLSVLITTTSFSLNTGVDAAADCKKDPGQRPELTALNVPVLQAIFCSSSENVWAANIAGLSPRDVAMNVALPEFDGRIITTAVSFKNTQAHDPALQTEIVRYQPRQDRIDHVAELPANGSKLRRLPNRKKNIAILLANYPSKNARVGNAVGLDTPASLHAMLVALRGAGYDTGPDLPADGQKLIEDLIAVSQNDPEFAAAPDSVGVLSVSADSYELDLKELPSEARENIVRQWGPPEQSPHFDSQGFRFGGLLFGNIFIGIQPARGYDLDPSVVYHSPDIPPPPHYLAFYRA